MVRGGLQEGVRRHRDAVGRKPGGVPQGAEPRPRLVAAVSNAAARRAGGDGRVHRRLRQRSARHLRAAVRIHPAIGRGDGHGGPAHRAAARRGCTGGCSARAASWPRRTGNNTDGVLNFVTRLDREFLLAEYRAADAQALRAAPIITSRIRAFLRVVRAAGPGRRMSRADVNAFLKSLWLLGVWQAGRTRYWALFWSTLIAKPGEVPRGRRAVHPRLPLPQGGEPSLTVS